MTKRQCSQAENEQSAKDAGGKGKLYGPANVEVLETDSVANWVKLRVAGVEVKCEWTSANVWARCPSSLDCDDKRLPAKGDTGVLYLSEALCKQHGLVHVQIKWPDSMPAATEYRPLMVWPTALMFRGVDVSTPHAGPPVTIDLLDPNLAAPGQELTLDSRPVTLQLSQRGFQRFFKPWSQLDTLRRATEAIKSAQRAAPAVGPRRPARELALAWAEVANWEEQLRYPPATERDRDGGSDGGSDGHGDGEAAEPRRDARGREAYEVARTLLDELDR
jgi:hypothetical protein